MADITFPVSPTNGDTYTYDGVTYEYVSASNKWIASDVAGYGPVEIFADRATAIAATVEPSVDVIGHYVGDDDIAYFVRKSGATALTTNAGTVGWYPIGRVYPDHYGENTTPGTTDMTATLSTLLTGTTTPTEAHLKGEYFLQGDGYGGFLRPQNVKLIGSKDSFISVTDNGDGGGLLVFDNPSDCEFVDVNFRIATGGLNLADQVSTYEIADNLKIFGGVYDFGVTDDGADASHGAALFYVAGTSDAQDIYLKDTKIENAGRVFLKANAVDSVQTNIQVDGLTVRDYYSSAFAINSPNGSVEGLRISGSFFQNGLGYGLTNSVANHPIGGANVKGHIAYGNFYFGTGGDFIHYEEGTRGFAAVANVGFIDGSNRGFFAADNDEGTRSDGVSNVTLTGTDEVLITTATPHELDNGQYCSFTGVGGTTELNSDSYTVRVVDDTNLYLVGTDSSNFTAYTSGGTLQRGSQPVIQGAVVGNTMVRKTLGGLAGFDVPNSSGGARHNMSSAVFSNNVSVNWLTGYTNAQRPELVMWSNNVATQCTNGVDMYHPTLNMRDTLIIDCDNGMEHKDGGLSGDIHLRRSDNVWDGSDVFHASPSISGISGAAGVSGWTVEHTDVTLAAGGASYPFVPAGEAFTGDLVLCAIHEPTNSKRYVHCRPTWNGTTFTQNTVLSYGVGITFVDFRIESGNLCARLSVAAQRGNVTLQVKLANGYHVW